jgi:hypothetical protein
MLPLVDRKVSLTGKLILSDIAPNLFTRQLLPTKHEPAHC